MALTYLSGTEEAIGARRRREERKKKREERRESRKDRKEERKEKKKEKGVRKKVAKVGLAPSRAAFLVAVRLNVLKLAKRLKQAYAKNPERVQAFWAKLGGKWDALKEAIEKGSNAKLSGMETAVGVAPEAALATALPVVIAVIKVFKDLKSDQAGDADGDQGAIDEGKRTLAADPDTEKGNAVLPDGTDAGMVKGEEGGGFPILPVAAGAAVLYFATRK